MIVVPTMSVNTTQTKLFNKLLSLLADLPEVSRQLYRSYKAVQTDSGEHAELEFCISNSHSHSTYISTKTR